MAEMLIQSETLTNMADKIRILSGVSGSMTTAQMDSSLGEANDEVSGQSDLIAQIATALEGKAAGRTPILQVKTITPKVSSQTVMADSGYDGLSAVIVNGDANLLPENIKSGVSIFGVEGTASSGSSDGGSEACTVNLSDVFGFGFYYCYNSSAHNSMVIDYLYYGDIKLYTYKNSMITFFLPYMASLEEGGILLDCNGVEYIENGESGNLILSFILNSDVVNISFSDGMSME